MANVLITGGAGYIGSELVQFLLPDHKVTVLDNLLYERDSLLRYVPNKNFDFVKGDVRDTALFESLLNKSDIIIPLAALVGFPLCDKRPVEAIDVNLGANEWLAQKKSNDQIVIYPCTNSGYGKSIDGSVVTEESPLNPVSLYGKTKVEAEDVFRETDNCATFRLATVCGPSSRMRTDLLVNNFVLRALRDRILVLYECEFMRNYVHIHDVCRSFKFLIDNWDDCKNDTYNLGHDAMNMNKLQLAEKIGEHTPLEIIKAEFTKDPDVRDYIVSSQKIYDKGFECLYDLDTSIEQLIKAYKIIDSPWYANYQMKVIWTNGCFDILHRGHVELFKFCKSQGDYLVVGIDTDSRVKESKGPSRPFNNQEDRKFFLESIKYIDKVVLFSTDEELGQRLVESNVDTMIVGSDWKGKRVVGQEKVNKVLFFDRIGTYSTTNILEANNDVCS